jgi:hypothetical protein
VPHRHALLQTAELEFVNVKGAQESIPPAYVAWWSGTITLFVVPARQATFSSEIDSLESIPEFLKRLQIRALRGTA